MVQKSPNRLGRPRKYDTEVALDRARTVFWDSGYAAASLDDLGARMEMNRPSLYGAFGDKRALYQRTLEAYQALARTALAETLTAEQPLRQSLRSFYDRALATYLSGEQGPRGCYLIGTALTESVRDSLAAQAVAETLQEIDTALETRIRQAQSVGEVAAAASPRALALLASAALNALAIRARAGMAEQELRELADAAVDAICL